jgi:serine acetyltransferase
MNAMKLYRFSRACLRLPLIPRIIDRINTAMTGRRIPGEATIGIGTELIDGGVGIRISRHAVVGNHVQIVPFVNRQ